MTMNVRRRVAMVAAILAVLAMAATPASAAITEKAAVKQVKTAAKMRLAILAAGLDGARTTLTARIDAFEIIVRGGAFSTSQVQALADDLADFQAAVEDELFDVAVDFANDGKAALEALADGAPLATIPLALANLPGGVPEQVRAAIAKSLAKTYRTVNKRLAKTSALVSAAGDASLFAALTPPPQLAFAFTDLRGDAVLFDFALDLRLSARTAAGEGRIWVGGTTVVGGIDLTVSAIAINAFAITEDKQVTSVGRGRFLARLGDTVTLPPTNYLLGAVPVSAAFTASASSSFALR